MAKKQSIRTTAEMRATPRQPFLGSLADIAKAIRDQANKVYFKEEVPLLGGEGMGSLMLGEAPEELERWSYGNLPFQTDFSRLPVLKTGRASPLIDTAFAIGPMAAPAARAVKAVPEALKMAGEDLLKAGVASAPRMVAYHGTPHRFPATETNPLGEFDASKIGTGEGAQAYGHGLYFAESPNVAKEYLPKARYDVDADGYPIYAYQGKAFYPSQKARDLLDAEINARENLLNNRNAPNFESLWNQATEKINKAQKEYDLSLKERPGTIYHVDLPDEKIDKMLDWDKPMSEQPESVRKAVTSWVKTSASQNAKIDLLDKAGNIEPDASGRLVYEIMSEKGNLGSQEAASSWLKKSGIPGIKYLDAGSRGSEKGTRNFVVFPGEEKNLKILERKAKGGAVNLVEKYGAKKSVRASQKRALDNKLLHSCECMIGK